MYFAIELLYLRPCRCICGDVHSHRASDVCTAEPPALKCAARQAARLKAAAPALYVSDEHL